jgi:hypothetical protein
MAIYVATDEDDNFNNNSYITEAGTYEFKTTNVTHKISQKDGTDLFEITFATKDGATMRKTFFWGDLALSTSQYKARQLIFMFLKACDVQVYHDELDSEDAQSFFEIVKGKKFTAKVEMQPDRNDPDKQWPEIGFAGFVYDQNHVLFKERKVDQNQTVDEAW